MIANYFSMLIESASSIGVMREDIQFVRFSTRSCSHQINLSAINCSVLLTTLFWLSIWNLICCLWNLICCLTFSLNFSSQRVILSQSHQHVMHKVNQLKKKAMHENCEQGKKDMLEKCHWHHELYGLEHKSSQHIKNSFAFITFFNKKKP